MDPCKGKVYYDTEFQATVVAARRSAEWGEDMKVYPHARHYHIGHVRKELRGRFPVKTFCAACNCPLRPSRYERHIRTSGHVTRQREYDKEKSPE